MSTRYTDQQLRFLKTGFIQMMVGPLTQAFNAKFDLDKTEAQIRSTLKNHRFRSGRISGVQAGTSQLFPQEQVAFIKTQYQQHDIEALTELLNQQFDCCFKPSQLRSFVKNHGITCGRSGQYQKGNKPWATGTKGLCKPNRGSFKQGNAPGNVKALYSERVNVDGYIEIKVPERNPHTGAPTRYRHKHVWTWEQTNGPVPDGFMVAFIDSNKLNCDPANLELITRAEGLARTRFGYSRLPDELKPTMGAIVKLDVAAREAGRV
tara:strand:+ start:7416 stop:8204 length:789 start_codon:yes stop_codon:yes gene_type:complete